MLYNLLVVSERATPTRSVKQKGGDARMLQKVLVLLVTVAIAVRIALDWMQDVKKPPVTAALTTNGPRANFV